MHTSNKMDAESTKSSNINSFYTFVTCQSYITSGDNENVKLVYEIRNSIITWWKFYVNPIIIATFIDQKPWKVTCRKSPISLQPYKLETIFWYLYDRMSSFYLLIGIKYHNFKNITNLTHLNKISVLKAKNTVFAKMTLLPVIMKILNYLYEIVNGIMYHTVKISWKSNNNWHFYWPKTLKSDLLKIAYFSATEQVRNHFVISIWSYGFILLVDLNQISKF